MEPLKCKKAVYSYYFPETRQIVEKLTHPYPHELFINTYDEPGPDAYHLPLIKKFVEYNKQRIIGLEKFPYQYFTAGASEGLFHILANIAAFEAQTPCYVFRGEYEGYAGYGRNLNLQFTVLEMEENEIKKVPQGIFFISNPSSSNGNILPEEIIETVNNSGHEIVLDFTYVGLTKAHVFNAKHPYIRALVFSMSKPYGVYYHRIGFAFTKKEMLTLEPNKWFKNLFSIELGKKILETLSPEQIYSTYQSLQEKVINYLNKKYNIKMIPGDVVLLSYIKVDGAEKSLSQEQLDLIKLYKRKHFYRFCLSPYFLEHERNPKQFDV